MEEINYQKIKDRIDALTGLAESRARAAGEFSIPFSLNPWLTQSEQSELSTCLNSLEWDDGPSLEEFRAQHLSQRQAMAE